MARASADGRHRLPPFWLVACSLQEHQGAESVLCALKKTLQNPRHRLCDEMGVLDIPLNLKFGSFDDLIRSVDILQKQDASVEAALRRVERQAIELDPDTQFKIVWQRHSLTVEQYIRRFTWDDAKFPRSRTIRENIEMLCQTVSKLDEEVRAKVIVWQDVRHQVNNSSVKKEATVYVQRDLVEVLTPAVVEADDFIQTEHLLTLVLSIPRAQAHDWEKIYEKLGDFVVPRSSRRFNVPEDKEGNSLWRIIILKKNLQHFKDAVSSKKITVREFSYSEGIFKEVVEARSRIEAEKSKHEIFLSRVCFAAFSDIFIAWVHLKAMRVFCEAVLRFGVPPEFAGIFLRMASEGHEKKVREEIDKVVAPQRFGHRFFAKDATEGVDSEEFYPYVCLPLSPFSA